MNAMDLAPLHVWSGYSLCRGCVPPERLIDAACQLGYRRLALTDVNGLYGATVFYRLAVEAGLTPIVGAELRDARHAAVALVIDRGGYENLCRILTRLHLAAGEAGPFSLADGVPELAGGLHLVAAEADLARTWRGCGVPADRLWLELDPATQSLPRVSALQAAAGKLGVGLLATGRAAMTGEDENDLARLAAAIRLGKTLDTLSPADVPHPKAVLRGPEQVHRELARFPGALANVRRVADQCTYALLPQPPVFPAFPCPAGRSAAAHLRRLCEQGARRRYGRVGERVRRRMERELDLIERKGFSGYFLVVRDIVRYALRRGAPTAGRGSGASSLVAYVLRITNVCPLAMDIPFERFLNERRADFPDLDIDFCWRIRDDAIDYAFDRWGGGHVAMVCMHNTFQERSAFRETAKAFGLSDAQISGLQRGGGAGDPDRIKRIARLSRRIVGLPRNLSVHPGGIVIGRKPIDHYAPIEPAAKGVNITQYDKDGVEAIGLVKLDLLGNRSLSTIREACELVNRRKAPPQQSNPQSAIRNPKLTIDTIPSDDPAAMALLRRADTVGCNQLESPAMRHLLRCMRPRGPADVMKALALIRPGAASIGMKNAFIRRQRGDEPVPAGHAGVDKILAGTGGVMLYEDDVMFVAAEMLGVSFAEADRFRRAVQKCHDDRQRMELSRRFLAGCRRNGVDGEYAKAMWVQMAKFNAYSFCRAHAASYARLGCVVAYLRAHHPRAFWVAALNNNQSMYHPRVYVEQAKRAGIRFLLPAVNRAAEEFSLDGDLDGEAIGIGFNRVAGLGPAGVRSILDQRRRRPFDSLSDFLDRTRMGVEEARSLILCGAFDGLAPSRPALMMELKLFRPGRAARRDGRALLSVRPTMTATLSDYSPRRKRRDQRRILGLSVGPHPVALWRPTVGPETDADSRGLPRRVGRRATLAGVLEAARTTEGRNGRPVRFFTFDDEFGLFEVSAFADTCRMTGRPSGSQPPALLTGRVDDHYGSITLAAEAISWRKDTETV